MTSWIRVTSNGAGSTKINKPRFVLYGGKGFYQTYGFSEIPNTTYNQQVIGYTPEGQPHLIDNDVQNSPHPINVGTPEVRKVNTIIQKELFRRTTIEWVCFSWKQLEYMTPYFLVPGITCMVEWGWNHFNPTSLVDIKDIGKMQDLWNNAYPLYSKNIIQSKGNYEVIFGYITNFNWSMENNIIVCTTEITSKDRLYAGITSDSNLKVKEPNQPDGQLISLRQFFDITKDAGAAGTKENPILGFKSVAQSNFKRDATGQFTVVPISGSLESLKSVKGGSNIQDIIKNVLNGANSKDASREQLETSKLRIPYLFGFFCGRDPKLNKKFGENDFDKSINAGSPAPGLTWLNMGLVVEILNHFSQRPGVKGEPMFKVDITTAVIGGHPNLMSISSDVLIPSYIAPKYFYGELGIKRIQDQQNAQAEKNVQSLENLQKAATEKPKLFNPLNSAKFAALFFKAVLAAAKEVKLTNNEYEAQLKGKTVPIGNNKANEKLSKWFYQDPGLGVCYRNDIDIHINEYRYTKPEIDLNVRSKEKISFSFPSSQDLDLWNGQIVEKDRSGLLSNIYLNYKKLQDIISAPNVLSLYDIYTEILNTLNLSVDGFWDLQLVEAEGKLSIVDRKYIPMTNFGGENLVYDFSYYDTDSLIRSLKFAPQLADTQATRVIYGGVNNPTSKYTTTDAEDMLSYDFKDAVIRPNDNQNLRSLVRIPTENRELLANVQTINQKGDPGLQMTIIYRGESNVITDFEVKKLILPDQKLLRELLDDDDTQNNGRYCAIQPGIRAEITLMGIGGVRTFQYFRIKNLPQPYSHKNIIFRITDVHHTLVEGSWETRIVAGILPLREYIRTRLGIPIGQ